MVNKFNFTLFTLLFYSCSQTALAADYYVATNGSDSSSGTSGSPWKTIGHGIGKISSGDTLIVRNGVYSGKENFIDAIPGGSAGKYTVVKAENPMEVRITNSGALNYKDNLVNIDNNYVNVDGFIFDLKNSQSPPYNGSIAGDYNKITRSIFRREGVVDQFGGWLHIAGNYNLAEDVAGVGSARYGFITGSSGGTITNNIFRRVVGRVDYTESTQPKAAFAVYGNNSGSNVRNHLFQNCIVLDSHQGPSSPQPTYGGFYFPKNAAYVTIQGSISLNNDVAYAGYFIKENTGHNIKVEHSVSWGNYNSRGGDVYGYRFGGSEGPITLDHVTTGGQSGAYYNRSSGTRELLNSLMLYKNELANNSDYGWTTDANNTKQQSSGAWATYLDSLTNPMTASKGADVTARYGVSGTTWGQSGFDKRTTQSLWPWAYQDKIKAVFSESNQPPSGAVPSKNNTVRGFTKSASLTDYVLGFLGNSPSVPIASTGTPIISPPTAPIINR